MKIIKFLYLLIIITLPLGQLSRVVVGPNVAVFLNDILIPLLLIFWLIFSLGTRKKLFLPPLSGRILIFGLLALFSLLLGATVLTQNEALTSSLFLVRWLEYVGLYFVGVDLFVYDQKAAPVAMKAFLLASVLVALAGFLQFIIIPDFSLLALEGGWDPHQYRLLSTFLDPNFAGGFFVIAISIVASLVYQRKNPKKKLILAGIILLIALVLTFSRSAYLAFLTAAALFSILKSKRIFIGVVILALVTILALPPLQNRLAVTLSFDDAARARLISWSNAWEISRDNFLFGVGFNAYRPTQARYGFIDPTSNGGHSGSGVDSSLLLVLVTTGIIGFLGYLWILLGFAKMAFGLRHTGIGLGFLVSIGALIVHSQFVNSFFYPQIMEVFWILAALLAAQKIIKTKK